MSSTHIRTALHTRVALAPVERLVLVVLGDFADPNGISSPTVRQLAETANVSTATVSRVLRRLEESELIERIRSRTAADAALTTYRMIGGQA